MTIPRARFRQNRDMIGVWDQIGDELRAVDRVELVGLGKAHPEEAPGERVPEGRIAGLVHHPAQFGQHAPAEARTMLLDKQITAPREQHAQPPGALVRMEEQPADFGRSFEIGAQRQCLVAKDPRQFLALLGQRRQAITVERPVRPDLPENLARPADRLGVIILEHEDIQVVARHFARAGETLLRARELRLERLLVGGKIGESAPRQLGEIVRRGGMSGRAADAELIARVPRRGCRATKRPIGQAVDDPENSPE